mmetsp:Transcript_19495/g.30655  ORF Transcript_19495/g.30655 Transcript_19495/m.30655 type:complete len:209 (+) Transcript_19495:544-1170(+)
MYGIGDGGILVEDSGYGEEGSQGGMLFSMMMMRSRGPSSMRSRPFGVVVAVAVVAVIRVEGYGIERISLLLRGVGDAAATFANGFANGNGIERLLFLMRAFLLCQSRCCRRRCRRRRFSRDGRLLRWLWRLLLLLLLVLVGTTVATVFLQVGLCQMMQWRRIVVRTVAYVVVVVVAVAVVGRDGHRSSSRIRMIVAVLLGIRGGLLCR